MQASPIDELQVLVSRVFIHEDDEGADPKVCRPTPDRTHNFAHFLAPFSSIL